MAQLLNEEMEPGFIIMSHAAVNLSGLCRLILYLTLMQRPDRFDENAKWTFHHQTPKKSEFHFFIEQLSHFHIFTLAH